MRTMTGILVLAGVLSTGCILIHDPDPGNDERCPTSMPDDGAFCAGNDTCSYGGLACQCGRPCQPAYGCQCRDGQWSCWHTDPVACPDEGINRLDTWQDAPPDGGGESCPDSEAANGYACRQEGYSCEFGPEACQCGRPCHPAFGCVCLSGRWSCWHTDPIPESWCADVPPTDASPDFAPVDAPYEYWATDVVPPACCAKNADCGAGWACGTRASDKGTCKPALPTGQCWSEEDCATGSTCLGVFVCPCTADCDAADQPGTCTPMPSGCCWTDADCGDGAVCRAQGGLGGLPGSCVPDPLGPLCPGDSACCWNDADCMGAGTCQGAVACGCVELCPVCGACAPYRMGMCAL